MFSIRGLYIYTKVCVIVLCAVALIRFNQNFGVLNSICFYTFTISPTTFFFLLSLFLEGGPCKLNNSTRETITVPAPVVLLGVPNLALLLSVAFFSQAMWNWNVSRRKLKLIVFITPWMWPCGRTQAIGLLFFQIFWWPSSHLLLNNVVNFSSFHLLCHSYCVPVWFQVDICKFLSQDKAILLKYKLLACKWTWIILAPRAVWRDLESMVVCSLINLLC